MNTYLHVWPDDREYRRNEDHIALFLDSGERINVESVLLEVMNGRTDPFGAQGGAGSTPPQSIPEKVSCGSFHSRDFTLRIESSSVIGNVNDDSIDPDFQSTSVLYLRVDDADFLSNCNVDFPFEARLRLSTDASMTSKERDALLATHGCRDR